jgi:hypothetical protein
MALPEAEANMAYTRQVLERGLAGDLLDLLVALAPCVVGYGEIGARLMAEHGEGLSNNPYREWVETYAGDEYQAARPGRSAPGRGCHPREPPLAIPRHHLPRRHSPRIRVLGDGAQSVTCGDDNLAIGPLSSHFPAMTDAVQPSTRIERADFDPHEVETWIFDLDNTLYPASCDLFAQVDAARRAGCRNSISASTARP